MAVPLKRVQLAKDFGPGAEKYCAVTSLYPVVDNEDVNNYIALETGLKQATIEMVLKYADAAYEHFLSIGHPCRIGSLGILKVKCQSKAVEDKEDVVATIKPSFIPSSELRAIVKAMSTTFTDGGTVDETGDDDVDTGTTDTGGTETPNTNLDV